MTKSEARKRERESESTPRALTRRERKAAQRRKILDSAREIFFRHGFQKATLDEVASHAGVAKGTLYRYFENKGDLYVVVLVENGAAFEKKMREVAAQPGSSAQRVRALGRFYFKHWISHPEYFRIFWALENQNIIGDLPPELVDAVLELWKKCIGILADEVKRGISNGEFVRRDPWDVANILWTSANGVIQIELANRRHGAASAREGRAAAQEGSRALQRRPVAEVFETGLDLYLRGLANVGARSAHA